MGAEWGSVLGEHNYDGGEITVKEKEIKKFCVAPSLHSTFNVLPNNMHMMILNSKPRKT